MQKNKRMRYGEYPYYALKYYLNETFSEELYKLSLNGGMTCPNRDGTIDTRGCIFCAEGSGAFAAPACLFVTEQIAYAMEHVSERVTANRYIAYFQAFTNTYGPIEHLNRIYNEALQCEKVAVLSIATRPDCLGNEVLALLSECNERKPVWVELGLQTAKEKTARYIRRGYENSVFETAVHALHARSIKVIVHVILGLPSETEADMLETIDYINRLPVDGVKLQLLHVLKGTDLAHDYAEGLFRVMELEEYVRIVCEAVAHLRSDIVIHRLTGDGPKELLIAPLWSQKKMMVQNQIRHYMKEHGIYQGCYNQSEEL